MEPGDLCPEAWYHLKLKIAATASQLKDGTFYLKGGGFYQHITNFIICNVGATYSGLLSPLVLCYICT